MCGYALPSPRHEWVDGGAGVSAATVRRLLVGGYTDEGSPEGTPYGVVCLVHDRARNRLSPSGPALHLRSPSYLAPHPHRPLVYAVNEGHQGGVTTIGVDGDLAVRAELPIPGDLPCHLTVSADGRILAVANYNDGSVVAVRLDDDGLATEVVGFYEGHGSGPHPRQDGPYAHQVQNGPDGALWVADLGADVVRRLWLAPDGTLSEGEPVLVLPPGTGPRQLRLRPDGRHGYVIGELSGEVLTVDTSGAGRVLDRRPAWLTRPPEDNLAAHLVLRGERLYASHRGLDRIVEFEAHPAHVTPIRELPTGGSPRHFALDGDWLYVADQLDDRLTARQLSDDTAADGVLQAAVRRPSCVLPLRERSASSG